MSTFARIVPVLLAAGLLTAACSSSSSGGSPASEAPTTASSAASTTAPTSTAPTGTAPTTSAAASTSASTGSAPSTATLQGIVVQTSDLPAGWTGKAAAPETDQDKDVDTQLAVCEGASAASEQDQIQQVQSDDFSKGQATISSDASSYPSQSDVLNQVAQLQSPKAQGCLNSLFRKEIASTLPSSASVKQIGIKLTLGNGGGPSTLAGFANGTITVAVQGQTVKIYIGAAFFTGHQLTGTVTFTSINKPLDTTMANRLVVAVAQRAGNA